MASSLSNLAVMVLDLHDQCEEWDALPWLTELRKVRSDFRCTLFGVPAKGSPGFWASHPPWIELAVHGWLHPDSHETEHWGIARMRTLMDEALVKEHFVRGFCAPGWQISDGCYHALLERDWFVADQPYNNHRRPEGLRVHLLGSPDSYHGHTHDVCGNGISESFAQVEQLVRAAGSFQFVSEVVAAG